MYHHINALMDAVGIGKLDPRFGNMVLEQFGGANGELAARRISKDRGAVPTAPILIGKSGNAES